MSRPPNCARCCRSSATAGPIWKAQHLRSGAGGSQPPVSEPQLRNFAFVKDADMKRKRNPIVLSKLADESTQDLRAMLSELSGIMADKERAAERSAIWSKRFAASGKR